MYLLLPWREMDGISNIWVKSGISPVNTHGRMWKEAYDNEIPVQWELIVP